MCWTNAFSLTTPLFLCTLFMTYMFSEQYNRQHANHFIFPQLSDHSKQQLLLMEGRREQDKQRNKQSRKLSGKEASKIILCQQSDFWKPLSIWQCLWHPVMLSVRSVLIMDVRGCVRCHLHIINTWFSWGWNLHSLKWLHFEKKLQTVNDYFSVTSQHKGNIRLYKRFLLTSTASILTSMHFSPLASRLYFHFHPTVTPSFILSFHCYTPQVGKSRIFLLEVLCCVLQLQLCEVHTSWYHA